MTIRIDKIIKSNRKTISLELTQNAELIVRTPKSASKRMIQTLVNEKAEWILKKQKLVKERRAAVKETKFAEGEKFLYLGKPYQLLIVDDIKVPLVFDDCFKLHREFLPYAEKIFLYWYKEQAREIITDCAAWYAKQTGLKYQSISINQAKTRWGSCSQKNTLNFTYRLVMSPKSVVDYVVVHELAHIKEKNHSKKFWLEVEKMCPNYKVHRKWLKEHGHLLRL